MSNYSDSSFSTDPNSSWYKIFQYIEKGSKVLDIGCSSGNFGKVLIEEKGCVVDGIELDLDDYKVAKKHLRNVYHLNIETDNLDEISDTYDYIYFGDVIEHLVTPAPTLRRIHHLLKPNGQLVFSIPNMAHLSVRLMVLQGSIIRGETGLLDKTHLHFYTTAEVERVLKEAGYDLIHFDPVLKDLPRQIIDKELAAVGLQTTEEFVEFTRTTEASIYQIVGAARLAGSGKKVVKAVLPKSSPVDVFETLLNETKSYYEAQLKANNRHIKKLEKYAKEANASYEHVLAELKRKDEEIAHMQQRFLHKVVKKIRHQ